tara:strand:- start:1330 stop:1518 length:189 start_codon:yes stop_codon:yes gene_type:complete
MKETNLFIVLDEDSLNTLKGKDNKTKKFQTEEEANMFAGGRLEVWTVVKVHFQHRFINHEVN